MLAVFLIKLFIPATTPVSILKITPAPNNPSWFVVAYKILPASVRLQ